MKTFRLKCKSQKGQFLIDSLTDDSTLGDLLGAIERLTSIPSDHLSIKSGFPPRLVDLTDQSVVLSLAGISSGDTVIAEQGQQKAVNTEPAPSASPPAPQPAPEVVAWSSEPQALLIRQTVPANNSCLFTSINFCVTNGSLDLSCAPRLRQLIAERVTNDPVTYSSAFLGMPAERYCVKLLDEDLWGGGIELDILSKHYSLEIDVVDTQTARIDRFGEDQAFSERILLIYDGIHYDPLALEDFGSDTGRSLQTRFSTTDDAILLRAIELAKEAQSSRQFTDVNKFSLKCLQCNIFLKGEKEAQEHAKSSRHTSFGEV